MTAEGATTSPPTHRAEYGRRAARGMLLLTSAAVFTKGSGFLANLVLGWLLSKDDFGVFAIAISLSSVATSIQDGGATRLIRHPDEFARLGRAVSRVSLAVNLLAATAVLVMAPIAASIYQRPSLVWLLLIIGASLPLGNRPLMLKARLIADLRFGTLSRIDTTSTIFRNILAVTLAWAGFGAMSLALPTPIGLLLDWLLLHRAVGSGIPGEPLNRALFAELFRSMRWIALGLVAIAIAANGPPTIIGLFQPTAVVGVFFFGMQIALTPLMVFNAGLAQVLMPTLSRFRDDTRRQGLAFQRMLSVVSLASAPIAIGIVLLAPQLVQLLWHGRWNDAVPVIQATAATIPFRLVGPAGQAVMESRGRWGLRASLLVADAVGTLVVAAVGARLGGAAVIAACLACFRLVMSMVYGIGSGRLVGVGVVHILRCLVPPVLISGSVALVASLSIGRACAALSVLAQAAILAASYGVLVSGLLILFHPGRLRDAASVLGPVRAKTPAPQAERPADAGDATGTPLAGTDARAGTPQPDRPGADPGSGSSP
ncbi:MAG: oligosaccharide flippase family protein [Phycisphaerales bacterium]|nr:oligosaccharide flippase family protein [Phycisphaerales bacterium]